MEISYKLLQVLIKCGRVFQRTKLARTRIGSKTLLERAYRICIPWLPSPEKIKTFWHDTMYVPKHCPFSLLILTQSENSTGSTQVFRQHVSPGMTVVDIGAHIGYYTLQSSRLVGENGHVYAFEPDPANFSLLTKNVEVNQSHNVTCVHQAVSDKSGEAELFISRFSVSHSLSSDVAESIKKTAIQTTSLDDFFERAGWPKVDFVKMNIEGWEYYALLGMTKLVSLSPDLKMMLEYHPNHLIAAGVTGEAFFRKLSEMGFIVRLIDEQKGLRPLSDITRPGCYWSNIYCEKN
jgi:FkbM family methyltransferase